VAWVEERKGREEKGRKKGRKEVRKERRKGGREMIDGREEKREG
jgi:hypothetical protein